jgi:hypothetical protein
MPYESWKRYEFEGRWTSYFRQVDCVLGFAPQTVLEIGVGNAIVTDTLKRQGLQVTTLDIDAKLLPDIVASVEKIPLPDNSVDVALCAEVLEHLPFSAFETSLEELLRVSKKGVVLSLPHWGYTMRFVVDLPGLPEIRWAWKLPIQKPIPKGGVHEWEINRTGYPLKRVTGIIQANGVLDREWISPWMPYHHFFLIRKRTS